VRHSIFSLRHPPGNRIGYYDMIVAATALERGSAVATFNTKHFGQIRGLKMIRPS